MVRFTDWLFFQRDREDEVGEFARTQFGHLPERGNSFSRFKEHLEYMSSTGKGPISPTRQLRTAWAEYLRHCADRIERGLEG